MRRKVYPVGWFVVWFVGSASKVDAGCFNVSECYYALLCVDSGLGRIWGVHSSASRLEATGPMGTTQQPLFLPTRREQRC
jgi:hypothetical protein